MAAFLCRLYSFDLRAHPGAVTTRLSRGFLRFGSLQLPAARGGAELGLARQLADYVVRHCYPHLQGKGFGTGARCGGRSVGL